MGWAWGLSQDPPSWAEEGAQSLEGGKTPAWSLVFYSVPAGLLLMDHRWLLLQQGPRPLACNVPVCPSATCIGCLLGEKTADRMGRYFLHGGNPSSVQPRAQGGASQVLSLAGGHCPHCLHILFPLGVPVRILLVLDHPSPHELDPLQTDPVSLLRLRCPSARVTVEPHTLPISSRRSCTTVPSPAARTVLWLPLGTHHPFLGCWPWIQQSWGPQLLLGLWGAGIALRQRCLIPRTSAGCCTASGVSSDIPKPRLYLQAEVRSPLGHLQQPRPL